MLFIKKSIVILVASIAINFSASAQYTGDFKSIVSGSWNDPAIWEMFDGTNWVSVTTYPGQVAAAGAVTITSQTKVKITASVPHPVASIYVEGGYFCQCGTWEEYNAVAMMNGVLSFDAPNAVSLFVSRSVNIYGELGINDREGTKSHLLYIGGSLGVGDMWWDYEYYYTATVFQTIDQDDKLHFVFNTTEPSSIYGSIEISFQEVTFNGIGISLETGIEVQHANFINGIVGSGNIYFPDNAGCSGASNASYVTGTVTKSGDDSFTFPIGGGNVYAPLTIAAPSPGTSVSARYHRLNASGVGQISDPGLINVSNCEYWELNCNGNNLNLTANWSTASGCEPSPYIANVSEVTLARFNLATQTWDSHGGSGTGTTTNGSVTWNGMNSSGYFTLGNLGACNAPLTTVSNITSNSATLSWTATGGATSYDVDYKPSSSGIWINATTATTATSLNLTGLSSAMFYDWRIRTNCGSSPSPYKQGQFKTVCGVPSALSTSNITGTSATLSWQPVSNALYYNVEYKQSTSAIWIPTTGISSVSYTLNGLSASTGYNWRVLASCYGVTPGNYAQSSFTTVTLPPCSDVYESNNTSSQAKSIASGTEISAKISSAGDIDWFKITTPNVPNSTLQIALGNLPADYDLYVYDKHLTLVGSSVNAGYSNEVVIYYSNARKATYYIKIVSKNGSYNVAQCYQLVAEINSNARSAAPASQPASETIEESVYPMVSPNPASDFVYLRVNRSLEGFADVYILNTVGQLVKRYVVNSVKAGSQVRIPVDDIKPGVYLLKITRGEWSLVETFVIAR